MVRCRELYIVPFKHREYASNGWSTWSWHNDLSLLFNELKRTLSCHPHVLVMETADALQLHDSALLWRLNRLDSWSILI
jgi:hypothetical protein